ncbi:MAG: Trk system potassium transporter TrkA [Lachnospiraceae bacterium]|nr:Trk system potassium transporter TrkA [Lachnospiraceae bacterium]
MKIIVAGCGKVGKTIVEQLSAEGHEIAIIDHNLDVLNDMANMYDVMGVAGNAASLSVQKEAGVETADLLIAVTDSDEINMLCCLVAKKAGNCKTIARVRNPIYHSEIGFIKEELGLSMAINPEQAAAREISRILRSPNAINIESFARGRIELTEFIIPEGNMLDGMSVIDVKKKVQSDLLICAVERGNDVFIPNGSFKLKSNDIVNFVASPQDGRNFFKAIGLESQKIENVMIIGGGTISYYLTRILRMLGMKVKVIEKNKERCEKMAELDATVICGDATNQELLIEEGVKNVDAFVSLTGFDEANIFFSLTARELNGNAKLVTKSNHVSLVSMIGKLNLGTMIYPKYMTAESIIRYVRAMQNGMGSNVETLYKIIKNKVEALEIIIKEDAPVKDTKIVDLPIKDGILIAAISRRNEIIYPNGQTEFKVGDRVVVITKESGITDIKDILDI